MEDIDRHYGTPMRNDAISLLSHPDAKKFQKALNVVAEKIECDRNDILTLHRRNVQRLGVKVDVVTFRYAYDKRMNDTVKADGGFWYDKRLTAWNTQDDGTALQRMGRAMADNFAILVDIDAGTWRKSLVEPANTLPEVSAFRLIPFHVAVTQDHVMSAITTIRPQDSGITRIYVASGAEFTPYEGEILHTRMPFLLFRYANGGKPRYIVYNVLGRVAERVEFGTDVGVRTIYARNAQTVRETGEAVFAGHDALIAEAPGMREAYRGPRLNQTIDIWTAAISDVRPHILCSDYVSIAESEGADAHALGVQGYVKPEADGYLRAITRFFDKDLDEHETPLPAERQRVRSEWRERNGIAIPSDDGRRIIVLAREIDDNVDEVNLALICHEMAHWLHHSAHGGEIPHEAHGPRWYSICAILQGMLLRDAVPDGTILREASVARYLRGSKLRGLEVDGDLMQDAFDVELPKAISIARTNGIATSATIIAAAADFVIRALGRYLDAVASGTPIISEMRFDDPFDDEAAIARLKADTERLRTETATMKAEIKKIQKEIADMKAETQPITSGG